MKKIITGLLFISSVVYSKQEGYFTTIQPFYQYPNFLTTKKWNEALSKAEKSWAISQKEEAVKKDSKE